MARIDNVIGLLRNVDDAQNFKFPTANIEHISTLTGTTPTIDCSVANVFSITLTGNTTFTIDYSNITLTTDDAFTFTLLITQDSPTEHTITFPASCKFQSGVVPLAPARGDLDIYVCFTIDGGTNWNVFKAGEDMS